MIPLIETKIGSGATTLQRLEELLRGGILKQAAERKRLGDSVSKASQALAESELQRSLDELRPAAVTAADLLTDPTPVRRVLASIEELAGKIRNAQTPEELQGLPEALRVAQVKRDGVKRELQHAWEQWVAQTFEPASKVAELLRRFTPTKVVGDQLKATTASGLRLATQFPPTDAQAGQGNELKDAVEKMLDPLRQREDTRDLLQFLDAVLRGGASLENVTPKLMDWLRAHNALVLLRISF